MVAASASGMVPIVTASITATMAMILAGCLNVRQAMRAVDSRIFMLIGASIASASALEVTGGARAVADVLVAQLEGQPPGIMLSALYLLVMILTNLLSNNATAVLFTPIAINMAHQTGIPGRGIRDVRDLRGQFVLRDTHRLSDEPDRHGPRTLSVLGLSSGRDPSCTPSLVVVHSYCATILWIHDALSSERRHIR